MTMVYNHIEWSFFEATTRAMGLAKKCVETMVNGVFKVKYSVLINGASYTDEQYYISRLSRIKTRGGNDG